jgi:hypothetical protein
MPVQLTDNIPPAGGAQIAPGEFVAFALEPQQLPGGANLTFAFVCEHRFKPPLLELNARLPIYHWYVGSPPPPDMPDASHHFAPDPLPGQKTDDYTLGLLFTHCSAYRLRITLFPQRQPLMDTVYHAQAPTDHESVIFTVGT